MRSEIISQPTVVSSRVVFRRFPKKFFLRIRRLPASVWNMIGAVIGEQQTDRRINMSVSQSVVHPWRQTDRQIPYRTHNAHTHTHGRGGPFPHAAAFHQTNVFPILVNDIGGKPRTDT
jgi:hypothetical protein